MTARTRRFLRTLVSRGSSPVSPRAPQRLPGDGALPPASAPPGLRGGARRRSRGPSALDLSLDGRPLAVWRWGRGPAVLLVHGWGSRGSRLASFIAPLTEAGYSVVAFDAPGHGASAGRLSSLPQFISAIQRLAARARALEAIVAHSMGGAATTLAMARGLRSGRVVFLAPAADPAGYSERFAEMVGLTPDVLARMKRSIERRFGQSWDDFDVLRRGPDDDGSPPRLSRPRRPGRRVDRRRGDRRRVAGSRARLDRRGSGTAGSSTIPRSSSRAVAFLARSKSATRASRGA